MNSSDKAVGKLPQFQRNPENSNFSNFRLSCSAEKKVTNKFLKAVEVQSSGRPVAKIFMNNRPALGAAKMIERLTKKFKRTTQPPVSSHDLYSQLVAPLKVP
jgi:hypothetical protein